MTLTKPISDAARGAFMALGLENTDALNRPRYPKDDKEKLAIIQAAIDSEVAKAVPPGFVVVPLEPTVEMTNKIVGLMRLSSKNLAIKGYKAMTAARPPLPQSPDIRTDADHAMAVKRLDPLCRK